MLCYDYNRSRLKGRKCVLFYINRRAYTLYMPWRHPGPSLFNDLVPKIGFNLEDVKKLGEFLVKLRNIPMGVLVILGLSRAWWNHQCDPGFEVQAEAHGLSCVIQERIPNNTTLPDAPIIVIPTPRETRGYSSRRKGFGQSYSHRESENSSTAVASMFFCARWSGRAPRFKRRLTYLATLFKKGYRTTPLHSMLLELLYQTAPQNNTRLLFRAKRFMARVEATKSEKPLPLGRLVSEEDQASESCTLDDDDLDMNDRGEQKNEDQVLNVLPMRSVGVAKGGNVVVQAYATAPTPPQEIHTGLTHGFLIFSLTPYNEVDVENHEEPEQASLVPNDTSDRIEREIASPAPSPYYLPYPFEEERSAVCQAMVDQLPTHVDLFCVEGLNDDQLMDRVNVLHCQKMIHEGELVAIFWGLLRQYEDLRTSNRTIATSLANDKEKSKGRKKLVRCQEKTIRKLTTEAQSELEIMTSDVKDLKKSLAERESELLGLKDELKAVLAKLSDFISGANVRLAEALAQVPSTSYPFFSKVSKHVKYPLKLWNPRNYPLPRLLRFRSQLLRRFRVMSSDITKMMSGIEESHHGPSDALHNPS
ncbi:hypothetical protein Tco_0899757 [Tanacetum coccineum]